MGKVRGKGAEMSKADECKVIEQEEGEGSIVYDIGDGPVLTIYGAVKLINLFGRLVIAVERIAGIKNGEAS